MIVLGSPWMLLLLPVPLAVRWLLPAYRESRDSVYAPFAVALAELSGASMEAGTVTRGRTIGQGILFFATWALVVLAMARPQLIGEPIERTIPTRDLLLAVDLSGSMETEDFTDAAGDRVDRLTAVKQVLDEFLAGREGDRVGLILFGSAAFVQAPFTDDLDLCRRLLDETEVRLVGPRTMIGDAIGLAINVFESSDLEERVLIVLTDGNDTGSRVPPDRAAEIARDRGITIHTVAVGDPETAGESELDEESLQTIAVTTGGQYAGANDRDELVEVYARLDQIETRDLETLSHRPRRDLFHWPIGIALLGGLLFHLASSVPRWLRAIGESGDE